MVEKFHNQYQKIVPFVLFVLFLVLLFFLVKPMITVLLSSVLLAYVAFPLCKKMKNKIPNESFRIIFSLFNNEVLIAIFTNFSCIFLLLLIGLSIIIVRWKNKDNIKDQEKNNYIYGNINNIPIVVVLAIISLFYIFYKIIINNFYIKELYEYDK